MIVHLTVKDIFITELNTHRALQIIINKKRYKCLIYIKFIKRRGYYLEETLIINNNRIYHIVRNIQMQKN